MHQAHRRDLLRESDYAAQVAKAEAANAFYFAHHFLTNEDPTAQAKYCFDNVGSKVAVMADVETQTQTGQYSDAVSLHGASVDFNVFLGSGTTDTATLVEEFKSVVTTGKLPDQSTWHEVTTTGDKSLAQIAAANSMDVSAMLRATACHYGFFDPVTKDHLDSVLTGRSPPPRVCRPGRNYGC